MQLQEGGGGGTFSTVAVSCTTRTASLCVSPDQAVIEVPTAAGGDAAPSLRRTRRVYFERSDPAQGRENAITPITADCPLRHTSIKFLRLAYDDTCLYLTWGQTFHLVHL